MAAGQRREIRRYEEPWLPGLPGLRFGTIIKFFQMDGLEAVETEMQEIRVKNSRPRSDREAVWTSSGRVVGDCDGELHHVGCERGEVPSEGMFSPDSTYEAADGRALEVRSDRSK
jgi:hypothetical protein